MENLNHPEAERVVESEISKFDFNVQKENRVIITRDKESKSGHLIISYPKKGIEIVNLEDIAIIQTAEKPETNGLIKRKLFGKEPKLLQATIKTTSKELTFTLPPEKTHRSVHILRELLSEISEESNDE